VHLSRQPDAPGKAFHIASPGVLRWGEVVECLRSIGCRLDPVPYEDWQAAVARAAAGPSDYALAPLLPLFSERVAQRGRFIPELYSLAAAPRFEARNTRRGLAGSSIKLPRLTPELLRRSLQNLVRTTKECSEGCRTPC
jgi:hypothetical protein